MKEIFDFFMSALPWLAIGLFVACSCVTVKAKADGKELGRFFKVICWFPVGCFLFIDIMEFYSGSKCSGTTWLVLGVANAALHFATTKKEE